jgi:hypothetical protein
MRGGALPIAIGAAPILPPLGADLEGGGAKPFFPLLWWPPPHCCGCASFHPRSSPNLFTNLVIMPSSLSYTLATSWASSTARLASFSAASFSHSANAGWAAGHSRLLSTNCTASWRRSSVVCSLSADTTGRAVRAWLCVHGGKPRDFGSRCDAISAHEFLRRGLGRVGIPLAGLRLDHRCDSVASAKQPAEQRCLRARRVVRHEGKGEGGGGVAAAHFDRHL